MPRPRRPKLGQHFLADARIRERIVATLPLLANELIVEIGPGKGAMTELLAQRSGRVVAVELDPVLVGLLKDRFRDNARIEVVQGDILSTDFGEICRSHGTEQCFVFGNLPYYITSPILRRLFSFRRVIRAMALLVQREVATRITAAPGSRAYGYLSVLAQLFSKPRIVLTVPPGAFSPPPKVQSALVGFELTSAALLAKPQRIDAEELLRFAGVSFGKKRKTLRNNLAGTYSPSRVQWALADLSLPPSIRAEQLGIDELAQLYERLEARSGQQRRETG